MDFPIRLADQLRAHLRALRKQRGLTQAELGRQLGLSQVRIADIEAKPGAVSVDQLVRILSLLGATMILRNQAGAEESGSTARASTRRDRPKGGTARSAAAKPLVIKRGRGSW